MKVTELIKILQTYNPEEQVIAQWYCKENIDSGFDKPSTIKQWEEIVKRYAHLSCQQLGDDISDQLQEVMEDDSIANYYDKDIDDSCDDDVSK
tara:strand:- start:43 stop:321 length:279 start_codon:yes stop_codon:yes gene_type:complete